MRDVLELYRYFSDRRYSTIAGTLVYFLLMSVTPFLFWLALLAGDVDFSGFISHGLFTAVEPLINYLQSAASNAAGSAGAILIITSLWSSTNFFYHLRKSGEIVYGYEERRSGLRLRLWSVLVVFLTIILFAAAAAVPLFGTAALETIMPTAVAEVISTVFLVLFAFIVAYLLNVFACPYKLEFGDTAGGVLLTVLLWLTFALAFTIYLNFAQPQKLYGAIAAIIVFLLWCYLMMNSLVIGIIYNGRYSGRITKRKLLQKSHRKAVA